MFQIENGLSIEGGMNFDRGIPIKMQVVVNNEYEGIREYLALDIATNLKFSLEGRWDDYLIYPQFNMFELNDSYIDVNGIDIRDLTGFDERVQRLADWVRSDFNLWHE